MNIDIEKKVEHTNNSFKDYSTVSNSRSLCLSVSLSLSLYIYIYIDR